MNLLKKMRENLQMSQQQISNMLNISQQAYAKWETGESYPRADKLPEIAKIFGCTIDELFNVKEG